MRSGVGEFGNADDPRDLGSPVSTNRGEGASYGGMEARATRLEEDMRDVKSDLKGIRDLLTDNTSRAGKKAWYGRTLGNGRDCSGGGIGNLRSTFVVAEWASRAS